ncbi:winged helix-turn-helix domain-containing protein [Haloferax volcanii]|uniref:Helix-turn-helix domain-containing protein n=2 Tax=Haloferax volcanii TaxID=2246 RepID=A0A558G723_HALVO|nr:MULTISPECIES: winged helix-turn-helix domain-containing protein [Haloferax]ELZ86447.1 transcriptional regulator [Haloferax alexandrinus JCM 10717]NLV04427.1 helix-turn-helix domain-containing protein [Haloferax alexandrinus]TVT93565.1 winged helix-turn-helix transcriptional regulator [Haloferax volcanii]
MAAHPEASRSKQPLERTETDDLTTAELFDLFGDKYTRRVYEAVAEQPRCGRDIAEAADVSRPTAYRRLNALRDAGLVRTEMSICEDGHHRERFEAVPTSLSVSLDENGIDAMVSVSG